MHRKLQHLLTAFALAAIGLNGMCADFVSVRGSQFYRNGQPYYFIGTNFWYGPQLAASGKQGNRSRLCDELDALKAIGVDNLRILVGTEDGSPEANFVVPCLQVKPGKYDSHLLDGLDFLIAEMDKRHMVGVFTLTNAWDWSGGYGYYLKHAGLGPSPSAAGEGWTAYCRYAAQFYEKAEAQELFFAFVRKILTRTNRYTHRKYTEEPAIMAWQVCNEPRPFTEASGQDMARFLAKATHLIKSLDPNHLVSLGSEGTIGCGNDVALCEQIVLNADVDYMTLHIWPKNWGWTSNDRLTTALPNVFLKTRDYIEQNRRIADRAGKPLVIEEFGYPRDHAFLEPQTPCEARNTFYAYVFRAVEESASAAGSLAGCNFWGWGGKGRFQGKAWKPGNDFLCDPPHEPQGWYSVYASDTSTISIISKAAARLLH